MPELLRILPSDKKSAQAAGEIIVCFYPQALLTDEPPMTALPLKNRYIMAFPSIFAETAPQLQKSFLLLTTDR